MGNEFLVSTRKRRANAGLRLKQLIAMEELTSEVKSAFPTMTDDDENVNLLFQEDGEDEEFLEEEDEEDEFANLRGIDESEDEEMADAEIEVAGEEVETEKKGEAEEDANVDADDVLSDSDISASDSDESEGEKELQKQEKKRKRSKNVVPAIRKVVEEQQPAKKQKSLISSDTLLLSARRSSSRTSAVESKQALVQKLKESEQRRAKTTFVPRVKHVALTQEQRLEEAKETERKNIISLNEFREQEIVKKEHQKRLLHLRRAQLKNVVSFITEETFIYPLDEIFRAQRNYDNDKKRRKGRKRKDEIELTVVPGDIDFNLAWVKQELEEYKVEQQKIRLEKEEKEREKERKKLEREEERRLREEEKRLRKEQLQKESVEVKVEESIEVNPEQLEPENKQETEDLETKNDIESIDPGQKDEQVVDTNIDTSNEQALKTEVNSEHTLEVSNLINSESTTDQNNATSETDQTKKVKFSDEIEPTVEEIKGPEVEMPEIERPEITDERDFIARLKIENESEDIEGPPQRVGCQTILLVDFEDNARNHRLNEQNIKSYIFGEQSTLPASRRFKDLKTIARIGNIDNPYAYNNKRDEDPLLQSITFLTEENEAFDDLRRLPILGIKQEIVEDIEEDDNSQSSAIQIKTEAPTGLTLPNNNKKNCLVSGTEVKYFDPYTGIPYSSVETYKFIKSIEQGQVPWYSFTSDTNDTGVVEIYLGSREGSRHAKGVPDGFDG